MGPLDNPRRELFAQNVAIGMSYLDAYVKAGYLPSRQAASNLMKKHDVEARVAELMKAGADRTEITVERVLEELSKIAFIDMSKYGTWNGKWFMLYDSRTLPPELTAVVSEVKQTQHGIAFKLYDKLSALEKIGKHLAMFTDKTDHTSSDGSMTPQPPVSVDPEIVQALVDKLVD